MPDDVYVELDGPTRSCAPTGIYRHELRTSSPFAIEFDLDVLLPRRGSFE
jgi:hypothetical protein